MHLSMSSAKLQPFCLGLNLLIHYSNGCHFADNIFKCFFSQEKFYILIKISLVIVQNGAIDIKSALVLSGADSTPVKFLAISSVNVDKWFMVPSGIS